MTILSNFIPFPRRRIQTNGCEINLTAIVSYPNNFNCVEWKMFTFCFVKYETINFYKTRKTVFLICFFFLIVIEQCPIALTMIFDFFIARVIYSPNGGKIYQRYLSYCELYHYAKGAMRTDSYYTLQPVLVLYYSFKGFIFPAWNRSSHMKNLRSLK